jgi:glycosyltransferase involved in cell wall biosynthesis
VGVIGRNDPQKDFPTFIQAATLIAQVNQNVEFILCGQGLSEDNTELMNLIKQAEIVDRFHLLGRRTEIELVYQALDILVSSSAYGEAFPMVIGEAMACGVPCVATDIGDTRFLIDDTGLVVPPKNPQTLASAVISLLSMADGEFQQKKALARKQILEHFSLPQIAEQYAEEFKKLIHS